jgi:ribosome-binding factor A
MVTEMKDPRVRLASVIEVVAAPDLRSARVRISAIGTADEREQVMTALRHAEGFLRSELGGRLENLKVVPRLFFELDESIAYSIRLNTALRELEAGHPDRAAAAMEERP